MFYHPCSHVGRVKGVMIYSHLVVHHRQRVWLPLLLIYLFFSYLSHLPTPSLLPSSFLHISSHLWSSSYVLFPPCCPLNIALLYQQDAPCSALISYTPWPEEEASVPPNSRDCLTITTTVCPHPTFPDGDHTFYGRAGRGGITQEVRHIGGFQARELASFHLWLWKSYGGGVTTPWRSIKQRMGGSGRQYLGHMPACLPAALLGPLLHPITQTHSNNRPQNNPNITYSTGTPKAPAINILLITDCTAQWKLCWPTIKAPLGPSVSQTNIHWEILDTSGAQTES